MLEWWSTRPAAALRTGGLGVRELKAAAIHLHLSEPDTALVIETASAAGLLATRADADGNPVWVPTDAFDRWLDADLAARWVDAAARLARQHPAPRPGRRPRAPTTSPGTR